MKRVMLVLAVLLLAAAMVFANGAQEEAKEVKTLKVASVLPMGHPSMQALAYFAELVEEGTNGEVKVELYGNSELGGLRDGMEGAQLGTIDISYTNCGPLAQFVPSLNVVSLPYIFKSTDHMYKALESEAGQKLIDDINAAKFVHLTFFDSGSRNVITNKRGVSNPEDMKGLKIRVMPAQQMVKTLNSMGGIATPMEQGEVYTALEQGVLDGWENSPITLLTLKLYEVSEYFSWTHHFRVPDAVIMSRKVFETLTPDQQKVILEAGKKCGEKQRVLWDEYYTQVVTELKDKGVKFTDINDLTPFIEAVQPVWDDYKAENGAELINLILAAE